jgi:hypothetical protein
MSNRLIQKMLGEVAVYWAPAGKNNQGQQKFAAPVGIPVRWDEVTEEFLDPKTNAITLSKAKVYVGSGITVVAGGGPTPPTFTTPEVFIVGVLWRSGVPWTGVYADLTGAVNSAADLDNPYAQPGAYQIRRVDRFPNRRFDNILRTVFL